MNVNQNDPFDQRSLNQPLSEKDFIQNKPILRSLPFWIWIFLVCALLVIFLGTSHWYGQFMEKEKRQDPFLEVTNRDFSLFLWQFPHFLRGNAGKKTGYLPGFYSDRENFIVQNADDFVSAPPDLIFLYHTWHRLLTPEFIARPISPQEFKEFLDRLPEWLPANWKEAPPDYEALVNLKGYERVDNLQTLTLDQLPMLVRQAFQGWKNYYLEGNQINAFKPTVGEVQAFLEAYPAYARHYWRNISEVVDQPVAGLNYLSLFLVGMPNPTDKFPTDQLSPFLKIGMYNDEQAQAGE